MLVHEVEVRNLLHGGRDRAHLLTEGARPGGDVVVDDGGAAPLFG